MRTSLVFLQLVTVCILSCKASVNADLNTGTLQGESNNAFANLDSAALELPPVRTEYFGVARRMSLRPGEYTPNCQCVAAVLGSGKESYFEWYGPRPRIGPDALVVAISTEGIPCEHRGRGPSIAAIDRVGDDVVVVLEEFSDARPIALGAIIPNPGINGSVFVRAQGRTPYGRPHANQDIRNLCKIGQGT